MRRVVSPFLAKFDPRSVIRLASINCSSQHHHSSDIAQICSYSNVSTMKLHLQVFHVVVVLVAACFVQRVQGVSPQKPTRSLVTIADASSYHLLARSRSRVQPSLTQSPERQRLASTLQPNSSAGGSSTLEARSVAWAIATAMWSSSHRMEGCIDLQPMRR